jgi:hypothetical protein
MLTVSNISSFSLNYLLYVYHANYNLQVLTKNHKFPVLQLEATIPFDEFCHNLKLIWDEILQKAEENRSEITDFIQWDLKYFMKSDRFNSLFYSNEDGLTNTQFTKQSFLAWWLPQPFGGKYTLDTNSDPIPEIVYDLLKELFQDTNRILNLKIFTTYDEAPTFLTTMNSNCIVHNVLTPQENLNAIKKRIERALKTLSY